MSHEILVGVFNGFPIQRGLEHNDISWSWPVDISSSVRKKQSTRVPGCFSCLIFDYGWCLIILAVDQHTRLCVRTRSVGEAGLFAGDILKHVRWKTALLNPKTIETIETIHPYFPSIIIFPSFSHRPSRSTRTLPWEDPLQTPGHNFASVAATTYGESI